MYNQITVIGNVGADPEMRYTPNGTPVCNFSVATNHRYYVTTEDGGRELREETDWFRVQAFNRLAEICNEYLFRGKQTLVVGRIHLNEYTDSEGNARSALNLMARDVKLLNNPQAQDDAGGEYNGETPNAPHNGAPENPPSEGPVNQRGGHNPQANPQGYGADGNMQPHGAPRNPQGGYPNYPQRPNYNNNPTRPPNRGGGQPQYAGGQSPAQAKRIDWLP